MADQTLSKRSVAAWCFYDWANSAFPTIVMTFVFATYYAQGIADDPTAGAAEWSFMVAVSGFAVAVIAPMAGAVADYWGPRKPWLLALTVACIVSSAMLWWAEPDAAFAGYALFWAGLGITMFELGMVFYNAMLPDIAPRDYYGRVSGWAWGVGYLGGLGCLAVALVLLVQPDPSPIGLDRGMAEHVRAVGPLAALWFAVFAWPLFAFTPDKARTGLSLGQAARKGFASLIAVVRQARSHANIWRFLIARMIYADGLNTFFAVGAIYAAVTFGLKESELIIFGIAINLTSGLGALAFAWFDDKFGAKPTIAVSIAGFMTCGLVLLFTSDKTLFWIVGLPLGIFVGPMQAASRSMMARLAPAEIRTEMFGLYALSGKATAFAGPAVFAAVTVAFASQRAGMATILVFLAVGLIGLLWLVKEPAKDAPAP
ncbi:MAG: MFS transporter [Rhodospirillales bacterium]